jgi:SPP1 gp7 family putative phage head morphogenesis protein
MQNLPPELDRQLAEFIRTALTQAQAEGSAGAQALIADAQAAVIPDFNIVFQQALDALGDLPGLWAEVGPWVDQLVGAVATDVARTIAAGVATGASRADIVSTLGGLLATDPGGAGLVLDRAVATALNEGALNLYGAEGLTQVNFLTAGDDRVCPECDAAEAGNPYPLDDAPVPALHFNCRCTLAPVVDEAATIAGGDG